MMKWRMCNFFRETYTRQILKFCVDFGEVAVRILELMTLGIATGELKNPYSNYPDGEVQ
jgi:hypothetical protein